MYMYYVGIEWDSCQCSAVFEKGGNSKDIEKHLKDYASLVLYSIHIIIIIYIHFCSINSAFILWACSKIDYWRPVSIKWSILPGSTGEIFLSIMGEAMKILVTQFCTNSAILVQRQQIRSDLTTMTVEPSTSASTPMVSALQPLPKRRHK